MKKILFFSFLSLLFTSCFEIKEEVKMNGDGSGLMNITLDLSQSKDNLKEYMNSGEVNGMALPGQKQMVAYLEQIEQVIESVEGMSNAKSSGDFEEFIFTFSGNFTDVKSMNKAVNKLTKELSKGMISVENNYSYANGQFKRTFGQVISPADYEKLPTMQRFVLESARIVSVYTFSKPIRKFSNANAQLSTNKKSVSFKSTLGDIAKGTKSVENTITF